MTYEVPQEADEIDGIRHRAGRYVEQPGAYRAFLPAPLPPDPPVSLDDELQSLLSEASHALGTLKGSIQILPDPELFVLMYVRKEAVLSSQIEGTQSSLLDLLAAEAKFVEPGQPRDVEEVINYVGAMNFGLRRLEDAPLSIGLIKEIHERLLQNVRGGQLRPGELRNVQNWIGLKDCTLDDADFVPPPAREVPVALGQLAKYCQTPDKIPALIRIGMIHVQFETIHPFLDGNGRMGRLLITFLLCQHEMLLKPVLYLSHFFLQHREEYYARLQSVRDAGDWEGWLAFFLRGVHEVSVEATLAGRRILTMREEHRAVVMARLGRAASNGLHVLEHLYRRPIVSVAEVRKITGTGHAAANRLVAALVEVGILEEITGRKRHRLFRYGPYVRLFEDVPFESRAKAPAKNRQPLRP